MPRVLIFAGPNGAGKTTFAREYLPNEAHIVQFVNADLIAAGLSPFSPGSADVSAGRIMLERLNELVEERSDFALETTLSGNWLYKNILKWRASGYTITLHYITLPSSEIAIERVAKRVRKGGHFIPDEVVRRRFQRSLDMLERKYKPIVDRWIVYDNIEKPPRIIDEGTNR